MTTKQKIELIKRYTAYCKEIDDNPFIRHKISFVERLFGAKKSQADYYKDKLLLELLTLIE